MCVCVCVCVCVCLCVYDCVCVCTLVTLVIVGTLKKMLIIIFRWCLIQIWLVMQTIQLAFFN